MTAPLVILTRAKVIFKAGRKSMKWWKRVRKGIEIAQDIKKVSRDIIDWETKLQLAVAKGEGVHVEAGDVENVYLKGRPLFEVAHKVEDFGLF